MQRTYDSMIQAADGMGISGQKGIDLTPELLKIPPNVDIKTWIDEYAKSRAESLIGTLDKVPRHIATVIDVSVNENGAIANYANVVLRQRRRAGPSPTRTAGSWRSLTAASLAATPAADSSPGPALAPRTP
jgi:hypothetical protein